jgi:hypothetical protein
MNDLTYLRGHATLNKINRELAVRWKELPHDPGFLELKQRFPELGQLAFDAAPPLRVEQENAGALPELTVVAVKIVADTGNTVPREPLVNVFKTCVLPLLRKRLGAEVLKEATAADLARAAAPPPTPSGAAPNAPASNAPAASALSPNATSQPGAPPAATAKAQPRSPSNLRASPVATAPKARSKSAARSAPRGKASARPKSKSPSKAKPKSKSISKPKPKSRPKSKK